MELTKTPNGQVYWFHKGDDSCLQFLHGISEGGTNPDKVNWNGPTKYISERGWSPTFSIAAPLNPVKSKWDLDIINEVYQDVINRFAINPAKLSTQGYSNGGGGTFDSVQKSDRKFHPVLIVAVAAGNYSRSNPGNINMPCRVFHAEDDTVVNIKVSKDMVSAIQNAGNCPDLAYKWFSGGNHSAVDNYVWDNRDFEGVYTLFEKIISGISTKPIPPVEKQWWQKNALTQEYFPTGNKDDKLYKFE